MFYICSISQAKSRTMEKGLLKLSFVVSPIFGSQVFNAESILVTFFSSDVIGEYNGYALPNANGLAPKLIR